MSIPDCDWPEEDTEQHDFTELAKAIAEALTPKAAPETEAKSPTESGTPKSPTPDRSGEVEPDTPRTIEAKKRTRKILTSR